MKKDRKFLKKLKARYRLMVYDDNTFQTVWSIRISRGRVIKWVLAIIIPVVLLTSAVIFFTNVRLYIPGYPEPGTHKRIVRNAALVDSLEMQLSVQRSYLKSIQAVVEGEIIEDSIQLNDTLNYHSVEVDDYQFDHDSIFQAFLTQNNLSPEVLANSGDLSLMQFFKPIDGIVIDSFNLTTSHYAVDLVAKENEPIYSVLEGTVIEATETTNTGYAIYIQHQNNIVSVYKHNSKLLKKAGDKVRAGEPIAIIGNTGKITTGPHLHFELWHKGKALNPLKYIKF